MYGFCGYISRKVKEETLICEMGRSLCITDRETHQEWQSQIGEQRVSVSTFETSNVPGSAIQRFQNEKYVSVVCGPLYNKKELQDSLKVSIDNEAQLLLQAYERWNGECMTHINGALLLLVVDRSDGSVFIGRDRQGKQILYYYVDASQMVFSTELKAIMHYPHIPHKINTECLGYFLKLGYIPEPDSILQNVYKLPIGSTLQFAADFKTEVKEYWSPVRAVHEQASYLVTDYGKAVSMLRTTIEKAIQDRLVPGQKFGCFLSSGIDSSLITAITQSMSSTPIPTYTLRLDDPRYNEADVARQISGHLGTDFNEVYMCPDDMLGILEDTPKYFDEPFADQSMLACAFLNSQVKNSIDIALGGDGGDEFFGGYAHYRMAAKAQKFHRMGRTLDAVLPEKLIQKLPTGMRRVVENRNPDTQTQMLLSEDMRIYQELLLHPCKPPCFEREQAMDIADWQYRRMLLDMTTSLPNDMIYKVSRAAGYGPVSVRAPLLDYRISELSFRMPQKFKITSNSNKHILRELAYSYVPESILDQPKHGFCVPADTWMRTVLKDRIQGFCEEKFLKQQNLFCLNSLSKMWNNFFDGSNGQADICYHFLMFQLWYEEYSVYLD